MRIASPIEASVKDLLEEISALSAADQLIAGGSLMTGLIEQAARSYQKENPDAQIIGLILMARSLEEEVDRIMIQAGAKRSR